MGLGSTTLHLYWLWISVTVSVCCQEKCPWRGVRVALTHQIKDNLESVAGTVLVWLRSSGRFSPGPRAHIHLLLLSQGQAAKESSTDVPISQSDGASFQMRLLQITQLWVREEGGRERGLYSTESLCFPKHTNTLPN